MIYETTKSLVISGHRVTKFKDKNYAEAYATLPQVISVVANYIIVSNKKSSVELIKYGQSIIGKDLRSIIEELKEEVRNCKFSLFYVEGRDNGMRNPGYFTIETDGEGIRSIVDGILQYDDVFRVCSENTLYEIPKISFENLFEEAII